MSSSRRSASRDTPQLALDPRLEPRPYRLGGDQIEAPAEPFLEELFEPREPLERCRPVEFHEHVDAAVGTELVARRGAEEMERNHAEPVELAAHIREPRLDLGPVRASRRHAPSPLAPAPSSHPARAPARTPSRAQPALPISRPMPAPTTATTAPARRRRKKPPAIGFVSLGCAKALVDSERILTRLEAEGYAIAPSYEGADLVVVNTCGFLLSARAESLEAIGEALAENGKVIVTGCLGAEPERILAEHPQVLAVTGPHQTDAVLEAIHAHLPPPHAPFLELVPPHGLKLTPRHYAYLKISEGCRNRCSFCIIPKLRGDLVSRPLAEVLAEAESLVAAGVREILVISQDTSAYGLDRRFEPTSWRGRALETRFLDLCRELGRLGVWVRLHYVYPYPHVDQVVPLMAEGKILPYLDIPFQHASPRILKAMRRPAATERTLERIRTWREICPELAIRSTFIVGFPGETEADFEELLAFLEEARLDRVGCFVFEPVEGAAATSFPDPVPEELAEERRARLMALQEKISAERLAAKVGRIEPVLVDGLDEQGRPVARSRFDAPEVDGRVLIESPAPIPPGTLLEVRITGSDAHDLVAAPLEKPPIS